MKIVFLSVTIFFLIMTVQAQKQTQKFACKLTYQSSQRSFFLSSDDKKEIWIEDWPLTVGLKPIGDRVKMTLGRTISILDATYHKEETKIFSKRAVSLPITLKHNFAGTTDQFNLVCYPRVY